MAETSAEQRRIQAENLDEFIREMSDPRRRIVASQKLTDARFLAVLRHVADTVVDATGEGRNGELWIERIDASEWLTQQINAALKAQNGPLQAMLEARARLGQNVRLVEDIRTDRIRDALLDPDEAPVSFDDINTLLDFVDEVRKIAKDI